MIQSILVRFSEPIDSRSDDDIFSQKRGLIPLEILFLMRVSPESGTVI